ncbi:MAG: A/G-specific adenine glycosylase [Bacteroidales bacterium]|nr:A/G-specific adenine glycosylase [Bacteroidales bacterium]
MLTKHREDFQKCIIDWYLLNGRDLPWRRTNNPYHIWICEIILQQTRVDQGLPYYFRFIERFPDIYALSEASEEEVLNYWQGLGYYSRARNILYAARQIVKDYHGKIPANYNDLLKIKGIGKYTAGAVASMAYNLPHPAIDGNVFRVLSRLFNDYTPIDEARSYRYFEQLVLKIFDENRPSLFNQSIIELGALLCLPRNPNCKACPVNKFCIAFKNSSQHLLPVKKQRIHVRNRYFYYFVIHDHDQIILRKRQNEDIWKMMYDFPLIEFDYQLKNPVEELKTAPWPAPLLLHYPSNITLVKHVLTHQVLHICFVRLYIEQLKPLVPESHIIVQIKNLYKYPMPKVIVDFLKKEFDFGR